MQQMKGEKGRRNNRVASAPPYISQACVLTRSPNQGCCTCVETITSYMRFMSCSICNTFDASYRPRDLSTRHYAVTNCKKHEILLERLPVANAFPENHKGIDIGRNLSGILLRLQLGDETPDMMRVVQGSDCEWVVGKQPQ